MNEVDFTCTKNGWQDPFRREGRLFIVFVK